MTMKDILIVGAGGFGREVYSWICQHPEYGKEFEIKGFLDDDPNAMDGYNYSIGIIGEADSYEYKENDFVILAIGSPSVKKDLVKRLSSKKVNFFTFLHPTAVIGQNVSIGQGTLVCPHVTITCDIQIGDFVTINVNSSIGHDAKIGSYSTLSGHCDVTGYAVVGEEVFLASHAVVTPKTIIEDNAVVGAGSVAIRKVKSHTTIFGVPAKRIN